MAGELGKRDKRFAAIYIHGIVITDILEDASVTYLLRTALLSPK
jgi:hypothetical protein